VAQYAGSIITEIRETQSGCFIFGIFRSLIEGITAKFYKKDLTVSGVLLEAFYVIIYKTRFIVILVTLFQKKLQ